MPHRNRFILVQVQAGKDAAVVKGSCDYGFIMVMRKEAFDIGILLNFHWKNGSKVARDEFRVTLEMMTNVD